MGGMNQAVLSPEERGLGDNYGIEKMDRVRTLKKPTKKRNRNVVELDSNEAKNTALKQRVHN